jgi:SAM-dependent methyltransferase
LLAASTIKHIQPYVESFLQRWNLRHAMAELSHSLRSIGLRKTCGVIRSRLADIHFDWKHGISTVQTEPLDPLHIHSANLGSGQRYQPTGSLALPRILSRAKIPRDGTFVDFGCGKGRTLILAALAGFTKCVGVDFSRKLCLDAESNIAAFRLHSGVGFESKVLCLDATQYEPSADETVYYFFHPFGGDVLAKVLDRIGASLRTSPRRVWIIYYLPVHAAVFEAHPQYREIMRCVVCGYECRVYEHDF